MAKRRVIFHGRLGKLLPEPIEVEAESVAEAIRTVSLQRPELAPDPRRGRWVCQVKDCSSVEGLFDTNNTMQDIHVYPSFVGGKRGGFTQILIGALLIIGSFLLPGSAAFLSAMLFRLGALLIVGGVLQMMQQPKRTTTADTTKNYYLSNQRNTVEIGTRIPIIYGIDKAGGHLLQFNINAVT